MKSILTITLLCTALAGMGQTKQPDTSKRPVIYWREIIDLQNANNELTRRIHKLDMKALSRDTMDNISAYIGNIPAVVYKMTMVDTVKRRKKP